MRIDPNNCRHTLEALKPRLIASEDTMKYISETCVFSHIPLLAMVLFAMRVDVLGPRPEFLVFRDTLISFYDYVDVPKWSDLEE